MGDRTVLVVDDEPAAAEALARQLEVLGHPVEVFYDAAGALARLEAGLRPMAVVVDVLMPGVDGHELVDSVRAMGLELPIVYASGNPEFDDAVAALRNGAVDFLVKPVNRVDLRDALRRVEARLGRPSGAGVSAPPGSLPPVDIGAAGAEAPHPGPGAQRSEREQSIVRRAKGGELTLPVPLGTVRRVMALSDGARVDTDAVFDLIEADPLLSRAIMRLAEMGGGRAGGARSAREALARVGARRALSNAVTVCMRSTYDADHPGLKQQLGVLWLVHFLTAVLAQAIAEERGEPFADQAHTMALFMAVGEVGAFQAAIQLFGATLGPDPVPEVARLVRGTHVEVGDALLAAWKLPQRYRDLARGYAADVPPGQALGDGLTTVCRLARRVVVASLGVAPLVPVPPRTDAERALERSLGDARLGELMREAMARGKRSLLAR
ncbi:MAG: response regulator [Myxococcales bacterium]|nr:response regulator [Myxococcales bacterium]